MKRILFSIMLLALGTAAPARAADVGVSISVGQPGFYGQIDIGDFPRPVLVNPQPVVIAPPPAAVVMAPIYLHVPPGHRKHWGRYCSRYHACGRPVYFVQDRWYDTVYVPQYRRRHDEWRERGDREHGRGRGEWRGHGRRGGDD